MFVPVSNFVLQAFYTYLGGFRYLTRAAYVSNVFLRPGLEALVFGYLGKFATSPDIAERIVIGMAVNVAGLTILRGLIYSSFDEKIRGTMTMVFISPSRRVTNYFSRGVFHYPNGIVTFVVILLASTFIFDLDYSSMNWTVLLVSSMVMLASATAFGLFLSNFCILLSYPGHVDFLGMGILMVFTGVVIPTSLLPGILSEITLVFPITNGLSALRDSFHGIGMEHAATNILREGMVMVGYVIAGYVGFRLIETRSKRTGFLDHA